MAEMPMLRFVSRVSRARLAAWASLLVVLAPSASGSGVPSPAPAPSPLPSLLFVSVDTWRSDYIGLSGSGRVATPVLDQLGKSGVFELRAITPVPLTTPAHATLLTGLLPFRHRIWDCAHHSLGAGVPTLAEAFRDLGYDTAAFVSGEPLAARFGLDRGFARYDDRGVGTSRNDPEMVASRDGHEATEAALAHLRGAEPARPLFLWVHYFDLHVPYRPRPAFDALHPKDPYAAQAAFVDSEIGRLLGVLRSDSGRRWRVVVVGDHGEGMGEHAEMGHGLSLYRESLETPLLFSPAPDRPLVRRRPWSLADVAPTLAEWFDLPMKKDFDGRNLFVEDGTEFLLPAMSILPALEFGVRPVLGIRTGRWMYVRHAGEELFDMDSDPDQRKDLAGIEGTRSIREQLAGSCDRAFPDRVLSNTLVSTIRSSRSELQRLAALGYMEGGPTPYENLQRVGIPELLTDVLALRVVTIKGLQRKDPEAVRAAHRKVLEKYPRAFHLRRVYGKLLLLIGPKEEAIAVFEQAVEQKATDVECQFLLGTLYLERKEAAKARKHLEAAAAEGESYGPALANLGVLWEKLLGNPEKAAGYYERFLALAPHSPEAPRMRDFIASRHRKSQPPTP